MANLKTAFRSLSEYTLGSVFGFFGAGSDASGFTGMMPSALSQLKKALTPRA